MQLSPSPKKPQQRRRSMSEAHDLVAAWRASGEKKDAWCRSQEIPSTTLYSCLARIQRSETVALRPASSGFIALHPPRSVSLASGEVRIELDGGARILGLGVAGVVAVLRGLRERSL